MTQVLLDGRRWRRILLLLLLLLFCLYLPTLFHQNFADDDIYLAFTNRLLREAHWNDLHRLLSSPANPWEYLPVRELTYWLDLQLWDDELFGLHLGNLVWYALSALALNWLLRELIGYCRPGSASSGNVAALCGTLLFVAHPAHVEAVAWIASRKDLVAGALFFLASALLVRALRRDCRWPESGLAALLFFAACFGKAAAMAGIVFMTVLVCAGWKERSATKRNFRPALVLMILWGGAVTAFAIHQQVALSTGIRIDNDPGAWTVLDRASRIFVALVGMVVAPYPLRLYHDPYLLPVWHWGGSIAALLLTLAALRQLLRRPRLWAFGVVLLFSPLIVYLQFVPFTTWSLASERFVFVAIAGLVMIVLDVLGSMKRPEVVGAALSAIVLPCAFIVSLRVSDWDDSAKLLAREYEMQPGFHGAQRDRILFVLLPQQRYAEATDLAARLSRPYATAAILALIDAERAYRKFNDPVPERSDIESSSLRKSYCDALYRLDSALQHGRARIVVEYDVSYNNILRSLARFQGTRYGSTEHNCGALER